MINAQRRSFRLVICTLASDGVRGSRGSRGGSSTDEDLGNGSFAAFGPEDVSFVI